MQPSSTAAAAASSAARQAAAAAGGTAAALMRAFAERTGLMTPQGRARSPPGSAAAPPSVSEAAPSLPQLEPPRRYLWTDAFAVCNFLGLAQSATKAEDTEWHRQMAAHTIEHVHAVLARHRADDPQRRTGWLASRGGAADAAHPTRAGLRIGKKLPEVPGGEESTAADEWNRDGQYFHYLTKHMHALDQTARALSQPHFNLWARELADIAHRSFVYRTPGGRLSMYWKMDVAASAAAVRSMGQHDALDGWITAVQLQHTARSLMEAAAGSPAKDQAQAEAEAPAGPMLEEAVADYRHIVSESDPARWATSDALGLGGLLTDAHRVEQLARLRGAQFPLKPGVDMLESLLAAAQQGLHYWAAHFDSDEPASQRLAFRELGLAIGLSAAERMHLAAEQGHFGGSEGARRIVQQLQRFVPLRAAIHDFWQQRSNQAAATWAEHEDINAVMLATSLAPDGLLELAHMAPVAAAQRAPRAAAKEAAESKRAEPEERKRATAPKPPVAFTPAAARAQPPVSESDLSALRSSALPVDVTAAVEAAARSATGSLDDAALDQEHQPAWLKTLLHAIGDARVVMIGEATHGTEEFYRVRAFISQHLLQHHGFDFVAVEGDHPDTYQLNRYVQMHAGCKFKSAEEAMCDFKRFPLWMWRNHAVRDFVEWLRRFNQRKQQAYEESLKAAATEEESEQKSGGDLPAPPLAGFYGLDLYSMYSSADAVIKYLEGQSPAAAAKARQHYSALASFKEEAQEYGMAVAVGMLEPQQKRVVEVLNDLLRRSEEYLRQDGYVRGDELIYAKLNALVVKDAEKYYRISLMGGHQSWNQRDTHMVDTLLALLQVYSDRKRETLGRIRRGMAAQRALATTEKETTAQILRSSVFTGDVAKGIVWAHNSHLGDARATQRADVREHNVGQLVRQKLGLDASFNVGFSTYDGSVSAARRWDGKRETMSVNPGLPDSYEQLMHEMAYRTTSAADALPNFMLLMRSLVPTTKLSSSLRLLHTPPRLERAIGVQYVKDTERQSHYFRAVLPQQFDVLLHFDRTSHLRPLLPAATEVQIEKTAEDAGARPAFDDERDVMED